MYPAVFTILLYPITPIHGNLLQAVVAFNKLDDCTLLENQQQVDLQFSPHVITDELQETKTWINNFYRKTNTQDNDRSRLDSTTTAVFTPLLHRIDQLIQTQDTLTKSFQKLSTNRERRAIKNVLLSLLSKSIIKAVKSTAISSLQTVLTKQFSTQIEDEPQQYKQVALYKAITKELRNKLSRGDNGQHMLNKISASSISFLKALQSTESQIKHAITIAEDAQQHQLRLLRSIITKTVDIDIAAKLQIPRTIEDIQVSNTNNTFDIKFTYYNTSKKIVRAAVDTATFNIDNTPYTLALPDSIALITNTTYIKNPHLQCYKPQQNNCACTELNKIEVIPPCLQQVIKAKKHLTHDPTLCASHLIQTDTEFNLMRIKNNIFSIFATAPENYTIKCNNKPTRGNLANGLNILSIPYDCTLNTQEIKLTNKVALPHQVGPSYTQIKKDVDKIRETLKNTSYSPKTEVSITDIALAACQVLISLILLILLKKINTNSGNNSRLITPLPDIQEEK